MRKPSFLLVGAAIAASVASTGSVTAAPVVDGAAVATAASANTPFQDVRYRGYGYNYRYRTNYRCSGSPAEC